MHFKSKYVQTSKRAKCALEETGNHIRSTFYITGKGPSQNIRKTITEKHVVVERSSTMVVYKRI